MDLDLSICWLVQYFSKQYLNSKKALIFDCRSFKAILLVRLKIKAYNWSKLLKACF